MIVKHGGLILISNPRANEVRTYDNPNPPLSLLGLDTGLYRGDPFNMNPLLIGLGAILFLISLELIVMGLST